MQSLLDGYGIVLSLFFKFDGSNITSNKLLTNCDNMVTRFNVNPHMIKWAREDAGFTLEELPKTLKDAKKWENGEKQPTWEDIQNLAKQYKRPSFFYFLKEPPQSTIKYNKSNPEFNLEIRKAESRRNVLLRISLDRGIVIPNFSQYVINEENPLKLANHILNYLNITSKTLQALILNENYTYNNFLEHLKESCFELGILVFETDKIPENEMVAYSIYHDFTPIIILNSKYSSNKKIVTLIHELVHLTHKTSIDSNEDENIQNETLYNKVVDRIIKELELENKMDEYKVDLPLSIIEIKKKQDGTSYIKLILEAYNHDIITTTQAMRYMDTSFDVLEELNSTL